MTIEEIQARLLDARTEYHNLVTGNKARVIVDMDGSRTEFAAANQSLLYAYIAKLEAMLPPPNAPTYGGPATFTFS